MKQTDVTRWGKYFEARNEGFNVEASARRARLAPSTAWRFERNDPSSGGIEAASILGISVVAGNLVAAPLSAEAIKARDDFAFFRLRFLGRRSTPWQERAAYEVLRQLEEARTTNTRRFVVINCPPGSGKSTLFTHDIVTWLIARDRTIRIMIGSRTERQAKGYVGRVRRTLERDQPLRASADAMMRGTGIDAEATMSDDYGMFRPEDRAEKWSSAELTVRQIDGVQIDDKEATVSAWGMDSGFLGGRFDVVVWDDLVDKKNTKTDEARQAAREWWDSEAETRIEPGGVLILQGQRISPDDLYRYCLDKLDDDDAPMYVHINYQAHDERKCQHDHGPTTPAWPDGCLLDPVRLPFKFLNGHKKRNSKAYNLQYQQMDDYGDAGLVREEWIVGGVDNDGYPAPGCLDKDRALLDPPPHLTNGVGWSHVTVDPSVENYWGVGWWLYDPSNFSRYLIDIHKRRLKPQDFLGYDIDSGEFSGILHDIWKTSHALDIPIQLVVFEQNAAQKWFLQMPHVQRWQQMTGVRVVGHSTNVNKADPKYGVESIADEFRQGMMRLPWQGAVAREKVEDLLHELYRYPDGETSDLVMMTWFHTLATRNHYSPRGANGMYTQDRPSWVRNGTRGTVQRGLAWA
jgi:hypothetical protein